MGLFVTATQYGGQCVLTPLHSGVFSLNAFLMEKTAWVLRKGMDGSTGSGIMCIRAVVCVGSFSPAQLR